MPRIIPAVTILLACGFTARAADVIKGRYVNVTLPGNGRILSLAEVQVFSGGKNVALNCKTSQSSTAHGGHASRAVDGNTDGDYSQKSVTHTAENYRDPAWEVDLGRNAIPIEKIVIWNRDTGFLHKLF